MKANFLYGTENTHKWKFFRSGGFDQVRIETTEDLQSLEQLDQKLWAVLSCPTTNVHFDKKTLEIIDHDHDGHIRVPEIIDAVKWISALLKNPSEIIKSSDKLSLSSINTSTELGKQIYESAKKILINLGKGDSQEISAADTADLKLIFANTKFNGDGIISEETADDSELKKVIGEIVSCLSSVEDRNGKPGITHEKIEAFFSDCRSYESWIKLSETNRESILPFGDSTPNKYELFQTVQSKIDDYFTRCSLAAFDEKAEESLNSTHTEFEDISGYELTNSTEGISYLPLSRIAADKPLDLQNGLNPAWKEHISAFNSEIVEAVFGNKSSLTNSEWIQIKMKFYGFKHWHYEKSGIAVEPLGIDRIRQLNSGTAQTELKKLVDQDLELQLESNTVEQVDKLLRYNRDLYILLNNFVSLSNFYTRKDKSIFQTGELYLDGRCCELCITVDDMVKHGALANLSGIYLVYCNLTRNKGAEKMLIAAAITNGDTDNIMVGRNGIFYDREGRDWEATVVKVIEHSISIRQAFWEPYKRVARMISNQIEKWAASKDKDIQAKSEGNVSDVTAKIQTPVSSVQPPAFDVGKFAGIFAAIGLAIGAIGGALAAILTGFLSLVWWQMPMALFGLMLVISGPSMLLAWFKLRLRNLGPLLDSNGWAVNTRAKINIVFGATLTHLAALPENSERSLHDPFAEKKRPWKFYWFLIIVIAVSIWLWYHGYFEKWFGM